MGGNEWTIAIVHWQERIRQIMPGSKIFMVDKDGAGQNWFVLGYGAAYTIGSAFQVPVSTLTVERNALLALQDAQRILLIDERLKTSNWYDSIFGEPEDMQAWATSRMATIDGEKAASPDGVIDTFHDMLEAQVDIDAASNGMLDGEAIFVCAWADRDSYRHRMQEAQAWVEAQLNGF